MSGLLSSLQTASTALAAFSTALGVEATNVSNSATAGYAAQRASISPILNGGALSDEDGISGGSDMVQITSTGSAQADAVVQDASSQAGWSSAQVSQLTPINSAFDITGSSGILAAFQQFSSAFSNAAQDPTNQSLRGLALTAANSVAAAFQSTARTLNSQLAQTNSTIQSTVGQINTLANRIQHINTAADSVPGGPNGAQEASLRDALDQLSSLVDITVQTNPNGSVNVLAGGQIPLVSGNQAYTLSVNTLAAPGNQISSTGWGGATASVGGQLGSLLQISSSAIPSIIGSSTQQGSLNTLAQSFADSVNSLLTSGQTASGAPGSALFTYDSTNGGVNVAASIAVDPTVTANGLALGSSTQANGVAYSISQLPSTTNPAQQIGGLSPQDYLASMASAVGQQLSNATTQSSADQTNLTSAHAARQQQSGVSLDTEAVNITADQRAYEASAQLVTILDQLTSETIQLIGPAGAA